MGCKSVLFFYRSLKLRFQDVEVNSGPRAVPQCCRYMVSNINGLHSNRAELAIASIKFDVVVCAETKITGHRHVSECLFALVFLFRDRNGSTVLVASSWFLKLLVNG